MNEGWCPGDALRGQHLGHFFGTSIRMILFTYDIYVNLNMYADYYQFYAMSSDMAIVNAIILHVVPSPAAW